MLTSLRIKNVALVPDLTLELQAGYNVITGETGAGKSIIIGALNLVLGERADRTVIRAGSDSCSVEAEFDIRKVRAPLAEFLDENGLEPCEEGRLLLKRTVSTSGTNRQFINGSATTLSVLGSVGEWLVDIHGPHDHQSLLHPARQLAILDAYGNLAQLRTAFAELLQRREKIVAEKAALVVDEKTFAQQLDLLRFQANEIKAGKLQPDEEPLLTQEFQRVSNSAKLLQLSQTVLELLSEEDNSLLNQTGVVGRTLQELQKIDPGAAPLLALHEQAVGLLHDLQHQTAAYAEKLELDPLRYQELEERLTLIQSLKRKYGSSLAEVIQFGETARQKLIQLEQRDEELIRLDAELEKVNAQLDRTGQELSNQRRKLIPKLAKAVTRQLADLGFKQSHLDVRLETDPAGSKAKSLNPAGFDRVEFEFAPNPGEAAKPLRAIASSGELARVMLALKSVLAAEDEVLVLVFDEVDANVGGETAHAVGEKMRQIAKQRQVLCITHLAPVAAPADAHYLVSKEVQNGRTISTIQGLDAAGRVTELARMLGGQSPATRQHAQELLKH